MANHPRATDWAKENRDLLAFVIAGAMLAGFVFLSKADASATYATKVDVQRMEVKLDRLLIGCGDRCK
jgi:hypothetical protein